MRRPAGVSYPDSGRRPLVVEENLQIGQLAGRLHHRELPVLDHCHAGRVIAPVLETAQFRKQDRSSLGRSEITNDSTHEKLYLHDFGFFVRSHLVDVLDIFVRHLLQRLFLPLDLVLGDLSGLELLELFQSVAPYISHSHS